MQTFLIREQETAMTKNTTTRRPEALPQTNVMLEKQLQQFQTQLDQLLRHNDDENDVANNDGSLHRKLAFLRTLLSMEMESHSETKPEHLLDITARLDFLEDTFHNWVENTSIPDHHWLDSPSPCSCTESCFEEERNAAEVSDPFEEDDCKVEKSEFDDGVVEAQGDVNWVTEPVCLYEESEDQKSTEKRKGWWTSSRFAAGVALLLMAAIGIAMPCWFHGEEFLVPT